MGLPLREALPEFVEQGIAELVEGVLESGSPAQAREWRVQMMPPGGSEPIEVYATFDASPWRAADGTLRGVITTGNLVTDIVQARLAARAEAEESEQRYRRAQADVVALQRTLLPSHLPVLPRTALAAHYLVAAADQAAGGDWFDALQLPDGRLALVVGDVVGHGIEASAASTPSPSACGRPGRRPSASCCSTSTPENCGTPRWATRHLWWSAVRTAAATSCRPDPDRWAPLRRRPRWPSTASRRGSCCCCSATA